MIVLSRVGSPNHCHTFSFHFLHSTGLSAVVLFISSPVHGLLPLPNTHPQPKSPVCSLLHPHGLDCLCMEFIKHHHQLLCWVQRRHAGSRKMMLKLWQIKRILCRRHKSSHGTGDNVACSQLRVYKTIFTLRNREKPFTFMTCFYFERE